MILLQNQIMLLSMLHGIKKIYYFKNLDLSLIVQHYIEDFSQNYFHKFVRTNIVRQVPLYLAKKDKLSILAQTFET
mgnify:CR=1 FL=1